jgi:hypothetical protein
MPHQTRNLTQELDLAWKRSLGLRWEMNDRTEVAVEMMDLELWMVV